MTLPETGPISLNDVHLEVGGATGTQVSLNDTDVRGLTPASGKSINQTTNTQISMNDLYGAVNFTEYTLANSRSWWGTTNTSEPASSFENPTTVRHTGGLYIVGGATASAPANGAFNFQYQTSQIYAGYTTSAWNFEAKNSITLSNVPASARAGKILLVFWQSYITAVTNDKYYGRIGFYDADGSKSVLVSGISPNRSSGGSNGVLSNGTRYPNGITFSSGAVSPSRLGYMVSTDTVQDYLDASKGCEIFVEHTGTSSGTNWQNGQTNWRFDLNIAAVFIVNPSTTSGITYADNAGTEYQLTDPGP